VGPTTVRLDGLRLVARDARPILEVAHITVSLAAVPNESEPLRIGQLVLDSPTVHLRPDPDVLGFVPMGFSELIESESLADADSLDRALRPSEILELRHVEINDGVLVIEDGKTEVLRIDGIELFLDADPAATPAGTPGHHAELMFGHPPGVVVRADAHLDLDRWVAWIDDGTLLVELSDPQLVSKLSPTVRQLIETHELSGTVTGGLSGRFDLRNVIEGSEVSTWVAIEDLHGAAGDWRLPIEHARFEARFADGLAHIAQAQARMLGGELSVSQADLAMADRSLALAGDLNARGLALHQLLRRGREDEHRHAVVDASGRVFVSSSDLALGLRLDDLLLAHPTGGPVLSIDDAEVHNLQLQPNGVPVTVDYISINGLSVDLQLTDAGLRGWPLPPPPESPSPEAQSTEETDSLPHWTERFVVSELVLDGASLQIIPDGQAPWRLATIGGTLKHPAGGKPTALDVRLDTGAGHVGGRGTLDLRTYLLDLPVFSVDADIGAASVQSLLPPELRATIRALVPSGRIKGSGGLRVPLAAGDTSLQLDVSLHDGQVALPGIRMPVDSGSASLSVEGGATRVANATLQGAGGTLALPAVVLDAQDKLTVSARATGVRLDKLRTDAGAKLGMGRLTARANLAVQFVQKGGTTAIGGLWMEDAEVAVDSDPIGQLAWPDVDVVLAPADGGLALDASVASGSGGRISIEGGMAVGADQVRIDKVDVAVDLADPAGRRFLPPSAQAALEDVRAGQIKLVADGQLSLADPLGRSTVAGTLSLSDGAWHQAGYRFGGLSGTTPVSFTSGTLRGKGGSIAGLGGRLGVTEAWWSLNDDRGHVRWTLSGLTLEQMRALEGGSPDGGLAGTVKGKGRVDLRLDKVGDLKVAAGQGSFHVRNGNLLALPALGVLGKEGDEEVGDDALDVRFRLDGQGVDLTSLQIDLGPLRYAGSGELHWTGAIDVHLESSARPGERATLADLAARLVAWDIRGTLEAPHAQALPLGIDTRTFDQVAADPRARAVLPPDSSDDLDDGGLDDLPEAGATTAPVELDEPTEFGDMDDLDDDFDDFE